ncbi:MAG: hypothetical protein AB7O28_10460 [Vicinamibacterales bacterium]
MTRPASWHASAVMAATALGLALALSTAPGEAHKAITSKYRYNEDLFPLFRNHCGRCHVDGGVAPMSLLTYEDAAPWGESLRLELLSEEPKPWHNYRLTPRELDTILVWATGGSPRGSAADNPPPVPLVNDWGSGAPDVALPMPAPFTLPGASNEAEHEVELAVGAAAGKSIVAVDLLPGTPPIVRTATLAVKLPDGTTRPLASWVAGQPHAVTLDAPVTIPANAKVVARIAYRRTWQYEGKDMTDTSTVGLYFAKPAGR